MSYLTYDEIAEKVKAQLDLEDEVFIDAPEMLGYCNDAIRRCESKIHTIYEDYFLTSSPLTLTKGAEEVDLPADLYANKIRSIIYRNGTRVYEIKRIKDNKKFLQVEESKVISSSSDAYGYWLKNASPTQNGRKVMLVPAAQETSTTNVNMYYLRRANTVTVGDDLVDIPEFYSVIVAYIKYQCYLKEGHPNTAEAKEEFAAMEDNMVETLTEMVPDGDNELTIGEDPYNGSEC